MAIPILQHANHEFHSVVEELSHNLVSMTYIFDRTHILVYTFFLDYKLRVAIFIRVQLSSSLNIIILIWPLRMKHRDNITVIVLREHRKGYCNLKDEAHYL